MKLKPEDAVILALELSKAARMIIGQLKLADMDALSPETRQRLLTERDQKNAEWAALAPEA